MPPPSLLAEGERISEPLPKPVRKDKDGREKKTLNVQVFGRRKARRRAGPTRGRSTAIQADWATRLDPKEQ